jgi:hypothetical protein
LQACHHGCKNKIDLLSHKGMTLIQESEKAWAIFDHFDSILGAMYTENTA